jgi:Ser/Thr protein kinase RdoA (MazF antagonist)
MAERSTSQDEAADAVIRGVLAEYDVGELQHAEPLMYGNPAARKVTTSRGVYLLKPVYRRGDVELQAQVARLLTARGIQQQAVLPTATGQFVCSTGYALLAWVAGSVLTDPTPAQVAAAMRHVGDYHVALGEAGVGYQPDETSLWVRVADTEFLVDRLPGLLEHHELADADTGFAIRYLDRSRADLAALPRQLVHGDIGPDNFVMNGDTVVSLIDFTPHWDSLLFAASTALYWFHVHGSASVARQQLVASLAAIGGRRPWTPAELALWEAGLIREALRRLATPLELARESGTGPGPSVSPRRDALRAVVQLLRQRRASTGPSRRARTAAAASGRSIRRELS